MPTTDTQTRKSGNNHCVKEDSKIHILMTLKPRVRRKKNKDELLFLEEINLRSYPPNTVDLM